MFRWLRNRWLQHKAYHAIPGKTEAERSAAVMNLIERIERQGGPE